MPRISKTSAKSAEKPSKRDAARYTCTRCGRVFARQKTNFPTSYSPLFAKNNGFLPVCWECVDEIYKQYSQEFNSDVLGAKRTCMKLDIYWDKNLFEANKRVAPKNGSMMRSYVIKLNINRYTGKTFDHTLREEAAADALNKLNGWDQPDEQAIDPNEERGSLSASIEAPSEETIRFWGDGYTFAEYAELEERFTRWTDGASREELSPGAETLYKQICILELVIKKNANAGKPIEQSVNQLNNLIGSVNAKPAQQTRGGDDDESFDGLPLGVGIRIYENSRPIPKPLPEYEDVDGIVRYILIWVFGHLCKLFHIKNAYSRLYEEEMERLRVERPDVADEEDEDLLYDVFGDLKREGTQ